MISPLHKRAPKAPDLTLGRMDALRLAALVRECTIAGITRRACVVNLSRLPPENSRPHHLRLARAALEPLANADRARLFDLPNTDLVVIWRGPAEKAVASSRSAVAELFADEHGVEAPGLWEELELPQSADRLLDLADAQGEKAEAAPEPPHGATRMDLAGLAALEAALVQADVSRFARRRQFCALQPDGSFVLRWERRFLSVDELCASLAPDCIPQANPWLFRRLTRTLDRRMLSLLAAPDELQGAGPFSISLNIGSILSPEFHRFDNAMPASMRGQIMLDLLPADVLADPEAFLVARNFIRARGYRLQMLNLDGTLLKLFARNDLGVDLMQIHWSDDLAEVSLAPFCDDIGAFVLSHADNPLAMDWGRSQGISLYQGRIASASHPRVGIGFKTSHTFG